jgi:hypothetical protein
MAVNETYKKTWQEIDNLLYQIKQRARLIKDNEIWDMADRCGFAIRGLEFFREEERNEEKSE